MEFFVLAGQVNAEQEFVTDFIELMLQHPKPAIRDSVRNAAQGFATHAPFSFASLRASVLHHVPIQSVDISFNLVLMAAQHNAPPMSSTGEAPHRDLEALQLEQRELPHSVSSSGPYRDSRGNGGERGNGSWVSDGLDGSRMPRGGTRDCFSDIPPNYRQLPHGYCAPPQSDNSDGFRSQHCGNQEGRGRRRCYLGNRGSAANLVFDYEDDDDAYTFMMDVGDNVFATASSLASGSVEPASTVQEQTAPAIPNVKAPMYQDMSKNGQPTPFSMNCFNSPVVFLLLLANALYLICFGVEFLRGKTFILVIVNSFSFAWTGGSSVFLFRQYLVLVFVFLRREIFLLVVPFSFLQSAIALLHVQITCLINLR